MTTPKENQDRVAAFEAGAEQYIRLVDQAVLLGWLNQDEEFELRLPDHFENGIRVGEGGCMRVKKRDYLTRDGSGNYAVYSDAVFQKTHQRFIPGFIPGGPIEKLVDAAIEKASTEIVPQVPDTKL